MWFCTEKCKSSAQQHMIRLSDCPLNVSSSGIRIVVGRICNIREAKANHCDWKSSFQLIQPRLLLHVTLISSELPYQHATKPTHPVKWKANILSPQIISYMKKSQLITLGVNLVCNQTHTYYSIRFCQNILLNKSDMPAEKSDKTIYCKKVIQVLYTSVTHGKAEGAFTYWLLFYHSGGLVFSLVGAKIAKRCKYVMLRN